MTHGPEDRFLSFPSRRGFLDVYHLLTRPLFFFPSSDKQDMQKRIVFLDGTPVIDTFLVSFPNPDNI